MVTVVIPAYNEAPSIGATVKTVASVLLDHNIEHEIIVVDDGGKDDTSKNAKEAGAKVIRHPHNIGYGRALKAGIRAANFNTICIIDADCTYPAEAIPQLLEVYKEGFDMVVGSRTGKYFLESSSKETLRGILKAVVEFTAGRKVPDVNSGLRIFGRSTILAHLDHLCDTFSFTTSLTLAYMMAGKFVKYIPIEYHKRVGKTKVKLFRDSLRTIQYIVQAIVYYNPIKLFLLICLGCLSLSAISAALGLITSQLPFYILAASLFAVSPIVMGMGFLADLVRQISVAEFSTATQHSTNRNVVMHSAERPENTRVIESVVNTDESEQQFMDFSPVMGLADVGEEALGRRKGVQ